MTTLKIKLPRPHAGQRQVIQEAQRFNVLACGRRFGKTTFGIDRVIGPALEGYPTAWFAPTYKMMAEVWRVARQVLQPVTAVINSQEKRLELITGGVVEMWSLDSPDAARGRKYRRAVIDEAAMIRSLQEAWQAVIRPTLTDYEGDGWFLSTPKGANFFRQMYFWGQDPGFSDWQSWRMPTTTNPFIKVSEVESARRELPERTFAQEYLAEFLEDAGGVFRRVETCATLPGLATPDPRRPRQTVIGVDWAKTYDFTVLVVIDVRSGDVVDLDRFNQIDWAVQRSRLRALWEKWRSTTILAERNSIGDPNIEALQREGLPIQGFTTTNATKTEIIEGLALAIETEQIHFPKIPELIGELQSYEMERLPSGLIRYGAPDGTHDDIVMALALARYAAHNGMSRRLVTW